MKIIIVGMVNSIHLARWIDNLYKFKNHQVYVFPVFPCMINPDLYKISNLKDKKSNIKIITLFSNNYLNFVFQKILYILFKKNFYLKWLEKTIFKINPKYVHSHELTTSSFLCLELKEKLNSFPKWIVSNWGSDIYFFYKIKKFQKGLRKILKLSNFYSAECNRDYILAKKIGTRAKFLDCTLNSGGIKVKLAEKKRLKIPTSKRKIILVKGYQGLIGLGIKALKALEKISHELKGYKIIIYSADAELIDYYNKIKHKLNFEVIIFSASNSLDVNKMYELFSKARIYIGISKSDGISTSFIESLAFGAFPIQSNSSCANELIRNERSGFIIKNNISLISQKILKAVQNDNLVDDASKINWKIIKNKCNSEKIKLKIRNFYK